MPRRKVRHPWLDYLVYLAVRLVVAFAQMLSIEQSYALARALAWRNAQLSEGERAAYFYARWDWPGQSPRKNRDIGSRCRQSIDLLPGRVTNPCGPELVGEAVQHTDRFIFPGSSKPPRTDLPAKMDSLLFSCTERSDGGAPFRATERDLAKPGCGSGVKDKRSTGVGLTSRSRTGSATLEVVSTEIITRKANQAACM